MTARVAGEELQALSSGAEDIWHECVCVRLPHRLRQLGELEWQCSPAGTVIHMPHAARHLRQECTLPHAAASVQDEELPPSLVQRQLKSSQLPLPVMERRLQLCLRTSVCTRS